MIFLLCELMVDLIFILLCSKFCGIFGLEESLPNRLRYVPIFGIRFYQEVDIIKLCFYFSVQRIGTGANMPWQVYKDQM